MAQYTWPPVSASNPSVGGTGTTAPSSATEIGGVNAGNLVGVSVDSSGNVNVNVQGTVPVSGTVTVVQPTGTNLHTVVDSGTVAATQSGTWNITNVSGTVSLPTGASTSALQTTGNTSIAAVATNTTDLNNTIGTAGSAIPTKAQIIAGSDGTNLRAMSVDSSGRQNVNIIGTVPVSGTVTVGAPLGQAAAASSVSVALANENVQDLNVTGQSAQTATVNNILTVASGAAATDLNGYRSASVQVVSTGTGGTFIFEGSNDNSNFQTIPVWNQLIATGTPITAAITPTSSQIVYSFPIVTRYVRLRIATTITGGSIQAFLRASQSSFSPGFQQVAQATAANLNATVTATNLSTNVAQINAVTPLMGNGVTGTGSMRVTIASDTSSNTNPYLVAQNGRTSANTPTFNTNSGANITTAAYLQLVASTTSACKAVEVYNQTSSSIYFATGAAASEVNQFIIPPGGNGLVSIAIAASTRISVKAVDVTASTGSLIVNYWT